jgi:ElaB/YqjD/DUF883 family membrane-anchored ribosome-binding protein
MASKDAEMPNYRTLGEDIQKIASHLANLRQEVDNLVGSIKRTGEHQIDHTKHKASEALGAAQDAVRRNPIKTLGIALGLGFVVGIVLRR